MHETTARQSGTPVAEADRPFFLLHLTWPIFIDLLMQMLAGTVALMILGRYSSAAVAAIGNANQLIGILYIPLGTMSMASAILISVRIGSNDLASASRIFAVSLLLNLAISLAGALVALFGGPGLFRLMKVPAEAVADARMYLVPMALAICVHGLYVAYMACFRSFSLMKRTLVVSGIMNAVNILLSTILVRGFGPFPELGINGVAAAAIISKGIALLLLMLMYRNIIPARLSFSSFKPFPFSVLSRMVRIGLPTGMEETSYALSQLVLLVLVNMMGTDSVSTRVYGGTIAVYCFLFTQALGQASQVIAGYLTGAGRIDDLHVRTRKTAFLAVAISLGTTLLVYVFSNRIFGLFSQDPAILALGKRIMQIELVLETFRAVNIIFIRTLQACGDVTYPLVVGLASMWIFQVGFSYALGIVLGWGLLGIWVALALDEGVRMVCYLVRWRRGRWRSFALSLQDR